MDKTVTIIHQAGSMTLNSDYRDILQILSEKKVKFILVGAYAMAAQGYPRSTMDKP